MDDSDDDEFFDAEAEIPVPELDPTIATEHEPPPAAPSTQYNPDSSVAGSTIIRNLDTGEIITLEDADSVIPISPFSTTIPHLDVLPSTPLESKAVPTEKKSRLRGFIGGIMSKLTPQKESTIPVDERGRPPSWVKVDFGHKRKHELTELHRVQVLKEHSGAIWVMKFSRCGRFLATAGQDSIVRVWRVRGTAPDVEGESTSQPHNEQDILFEPEAYRVFSGHTADVLDVAWSRNHFLLSSSMDKTVRLWHVLRKSCLCVFPHVDFVTAVDFHPLNERYFLSGSLDEKIRIWAIPEKKVIHWAKARGLVTACAFNFDGSVAMCGLYNGLLCFYQTDGLRLLTQIHVRSARGKNSKGKKITGIQLTPDGDKVMVTSNDSRIRIYSMKSYEQVNKYSGLVNETSQIRSSLSDGGNYIVCGSEDKRVFVWNTMDDQPEDRSRWKFGSTKNENFECFQANDHVVTAALFVPSGARDVVAGDAPQISLSHSDLPMSPSEAPLPPLSPAVETTTAPVPPVPSQKESLVGAMIVCADYSGEICVLRNTGHPQWKHGAHM